MNLMSFRFQIEATDGRARAGRFFTPHGEVGRLSHARRDGRNSEGSSAGHAGRVGIQILLNNTYHLYLRPGVQTVRELGGRKSSWGGSGRS